MTRAKQEASTSDRGQHSHLPTGDGLVAATAPLPDMQDAATDGGDVASLVRPDHDVLRVRGFVVWWGADATPVCAGMACGVGAEGTQTVGGSRAVV